MKVKELIEKLKECNPEGDVMGAHKLFTGAMCEIEEVDDYSKLFVADVEQEDHEPFVLLYIGKDQS